jgi:hypothetical protein
MGITTQNLPLGFRQISGDSSSLRQSVLPLLKTSARKRALNAISGGLTSISAGARSTADEALGGREVASFFPRQVKLLRLYRRVPAAT